MISPWKQAKIRRVFGGNHNYSETAKECDVDPKTVHKYSDPQLSPKPVEKSLRAYKTRVAAEFEGFWPEIESLLKENHGLKPYAILDHMIEKHNEAFSPSWQRTLERRISNWKIENGVGKDVSFSQIHKPGDLLAIDFTDLSKLAIRIGVQNAFHSLGGVTDRVRFDSMSAAVNNLSSDHEFRSNWQALLDHFGTKGHRINVRSPQENGDCESSHGRLKKLRLPVMRTMAMQLADQAARENWTFLEYLSELTDHECLKRTENRIARHLKNSSLDTTKVWSAIRWNRLPMTVQQRMQQLQTGEFLSRAENILIFGKPGSGKTMLLSALGDQLVRAGHTVCFAPCVKLVQYLLLAKRELRLPQMLAKLGRFSALIIDDLGYVQQSREEMEVLFTLIADRYERTSILLSSNLPFSKWEQIFKDPMTTAAAIDRLVHRSTILELNVPSIRLEEAKANQEKQRLQDEATRSSPPGNPTNSNQEISLSLKRKSSASDLK